TGGVPRAGMSRVPVGLKRIVIREVAAHRAGLVRHGAGRPVLRRMRLGRACRRVCGIARGSVVRQAGIGREVIAGESRLPVRRAAVGGGWGAGRASRGGPAGGAAAAASGDPAEVARVPLPAVFDAAIAFAAALAGAAAVAAEAALAIAAAEAAVAAATAAAR